MSKRNQNLIEELRKGKTLEQIMEQSMEQQKIWKQERENKERQLKHRPQQD